MQQKRTISDLMLEQFVLGELPVDRERAVREELARDKDLQARLAALQASDAEIRASYPAEQVVPQIREKMLRDGAGAARPRRRMNAVWWAVPLAATVLIALTLSVVVLRPNDTRLKGMSPHLTLFRKTASGAEELRPGTVARRGDVLQVSYAAGEAKYGVILSIDGRGTITWHVPAGYSGGARTAPPLDERGTVVLPNAYELDDAPRFERFFLIYGSSPFEISDIERIIRGLAARPSTADRDTLTLPRGLGQYSFVLSKQG
jgi:hypothetical protein